MSPWLFLLFIVGDILGTGLYALTGQVLADWGTEAVGGLSSTTLKELSLTGAGTES